MEADALYMVYATVETKEQAVFIARTLLDERLIACANIIPAIYSVYEWEGKVVEATEVVMIMKTMAALVQRTSDRIRQLHSYECPCIVSWPVETGNPDFLAWVGESVK